jgi:hypothetical protein
MWIFTDTGFVSAVKKPQDGGLISVRARDKSSLNELISQTKAELVQTPNGDYPWRIFVTQEQFAHWVTEVALNLNYSNFKSRVHKVNPSATYINSLHDVWAVMTHTEDEGARTTNLTPQLGEVGPTDAELKAIERESES